MDATLNINAISAALGSFVGHVLFGLAVAAVLAVGHHMFTIKGAR